LAIAFIAEGPATDGGKCATSSGSYTVARGRTSWLRRSTLAPRSVSLRNGAISHPENVVGTATWGRFVLRLMALLKPIAVPPPIARRASAFTEDAAVSAASVTSIGVFGCAPG
jgi:hypothetical protein